MYVESEYRCGYKFKADGNWMYRKDWDTGEVVKMKMTSTSKEILEDFDGDPQRAWFYLHDLWGELREELKYNTELDDVYESADKDDFQ